MLTVDDLLRDPPALHGDPRDPTLYTLHPPALRFLERTVRPGDRTLETGSGLSTIVLAASGAEHTCVVPNPEQSRRIVEFCQLRGLPTDGLEFQLERSEVVLPRLDPVPLDLVLLDGSHAFPQVFIDWYYTAGRLKVGGHLVVDDVHIWTGTVLRDFLAADPAWELVEQLRARTAVLRKVADADLSADWDRQPYVVRRSRWAVAAKARIVASMVAERDLQELGRMVRRQLGGR
jgi:predicted O-methyltransferase YrrM